MLALALGLKHSYDADHLLAVSNLLVKSGSMKQTLGLCASWSIGHMATAAAITILLYQLRAATALIAALSYFEFAVALMLIALGVLALKDMAVVHSHVHAHDGEVHRHVHVHPRKERGHHHGHMFGIGIVQGLASNDELLILFTISLGVSTLPGMLANLAIYTIGVIAGMMVFGAIVVSPLFLNEKLRRTVAIAWGSLGIAYGLLMLGGLV